MKRFLIGLAVILIVGLVGFTIFAWRPAYVRIAPPAPTSFAADQVARGAILASAGYCATCHTARAGKPYAGGYAMATQFGTIYSTNITPDADTGIGTWSEPAFRRAMHEGVRRDGRHLLPAFPYDHFTKLSDTDVADLYAFLMTRTPVSAPAHSNTIPFPLSIRALQAGWKLLFFHPGRYRPDSSRSATWNRGAYLAQGLSHCGACHTPRGALGAERRREAFAGAPIDGWIAPPLTRANPSPVPWSQDELASYLSTGISRYHGIAAGPMGPVARGLAALPAADTQALAFYFADVSGSAARTAEIAPAIARAQAANRIGTGLQYAPAARLYTAACASCHYNGKGEPNPLRPDLALNSAINLDDPTNLIRVVLYGISASDGAPGVVMPGFGRGFTDADVARIAAYLRATRTGKPAWPDLEGKVAAIRKQKQGQE